MEVTALCIQIFINVFVLLLTHPGSSYTVEKPGLPIVSPDRLQFFVRESVVISCGGDKEVNAWRVMRKLHNISSLNLSKGCSFPAPSCIIGHALKRHSGEYWCENDEGERSRALNISVTAGSVILNLPAQPVKEGSNVTLRCFNPDTEEKHFSDFYKDGHHLGTYYETDMVLSNVSKSDEGLYKCSISGTGESPGSWLAVVRPKEEEGSNEGKQPSMNLSLIIIILLVIIFTLLFLAIGLILYNKHRAVKNEIVSDPKDRMYAMVNKLRQRNGGDTANDLIDVTYAAVEIHKKGSKVSTATTLHYSSDQEPVYSLITHPTRKFK